MAETQDKTPRPPVIAIMGHIDHGKSTLLDYIRNSNTVSGEAGGITQHLSAYEVNHKTSEGKEARITFLDTPGHEAFSAIRTRGVHVADIAVLVVSAEDGVKPQTLEALKCIQSEDIPFIVAINKIDKPGANIEQTKTNLAENEIYVEGWGGDVPVVPISALNGDGVSDLLDTMVLLADLEELAGDSKKAATGIVIESNMDPQKGATATLIIKDGTLSKGQFVASGSALSPVRIMIDYRGKSIESATFSTPVRIIGWNTLPQVGTIFESFENKKEAEAFTAENAKNEEKVQNPLPQVKEGEEKKIIPLIIKTDTAGSSDAVIQEISKINVDDRIVTHVLYSEIGAVSEGDIKTAAAHKDTIVLAFHTKFDTPIAQLAERMDVEVKAYDVIYEMTEWLTQALKDRTPLSKIDEITGEAKIIRKFSSQKTKHVVGGKVISGIFKLGKEVKVIRRDEEIGKGVIKELQQQKSNVDSISDGDFGMMIDSKIDIVEGDRLQAFSVVEK